MLVQVFSVTKVIPCWVIFYVIMALPKPDGELELSDWAVGALLLMIYWGILKHLRPTLAVELWQLWIRLVYGRREKAS